MSKNLVIVESPAKAKTISRFLGKDYKVLASMGHVMDLPKSQMGIDIENNFEPNYIISVDKKKVVKQLKDELNKADDLWIATDEDREGEAIGWHLLAALKLKEDDHVKRIVFHEITKSAILMRLSTPVQLIIASLMLSRHGGYLIDWWVMNFHRCFGKKFVMVFLLAAYRVLPCDLSSSASARYVPLKPRSIGA